MIEPTSMFQPEDAKTRQELQSICDLFSNSNSGAFAIATSKRLGIQAVIVFDLANEPVHACCAFNEALFFDATGPFTSAHLWQRYRMPLRPEKADCEKIAAVFNVTERDLEEAEKALEALSTVLAQKAYH